MYTSSRKNLPSTLLRFYNKYKNGNYLTTTKLYRNILQSGDFYRTGNIVLASQTHGLLDWIFFCQSALLYGDLRTVIA